MSTPSLKKLTAQLLNEIETFEELYKEALNLLVELWQLTLTRTLL